MEKINKIDIHKALRLIKEQVEVKILPKNITEQYAHVCLRMIETGQENSVYFYGYNIRLDNQWIKLPPMLISKTLIDVALKMGVNQTKVYRDRNRLLKNYFGISQTTMPPLLMELPKEDEGSGASLVLADHYIQKHYPNTKFNIISEATDFGVKGKTFDDVITELRMEDTRISSSEFETYLRSDKVENHDPFEEYFGSLSWDGTTDHIMKLSEFVKTENQEFWGSMFKKHLVRSVAQAKEDGKFSNRFVIVLMAKAEFLGKSTFIRYLNPFDGQYYFEHLDKDVMLGLTKNFILNLEEVESLNSIGFNKLKAIISMPSANMRTLFTQNYKTRVRRCSIWASTNNLEFLGGGENTRWLIINVESINFGYDKMDGVNIDDVWSQAVALFNSGFDYELTRDEWEIAKGVSKEHRFKSNEAEFITEFFQPSGIYSATPTEISLLLQKQHDRILSAQKIGTALTGMEYEKITKHGGRSYYMIETIDGISVDEALNNFEPKSGGSSVRPW